MRILLYALLVLSIGCSSTVKPFSVGEFHYRYAVQPGAVPLAAAFDDDEHTYLYLEKPGQPIVVRDRYGNVHTATGWEDYSIVHGLHDELFLSTTNETDLNEATVVKRIKDDIQIDG